MKKTITSKHKLNGNFQLNWRKQSLVVMLFCLLSIPALHAQNDLPNPTANMMLIKNGSMVIGMDNTTQAIPGHFNMKAYGLVNKLLQNNIQVKWAIRAGKLKDEADFSSTAQRIYPTTLPATTYNFKSGPFIIDSANVAAALPYISTWGNSVAVYRLTQDVMVDIRHTLSFKPKVALLDNGGNGKIHLEYLKQAGMDTGSYAKLYQKLLPLSSCGYTFASESHWNDHVDTAVTHSIYRFVKSGGNFLAECVSIEIYENDDTMHTTTGIDFGNIGGYNSFTYSNADMPFLQIDGPLDIIGGALHNWRNKTNGSYRSYQYPVLTTPTTIPNQAAAVAKCVASNLAGGNMFYLGGHSYDDNGNNDKINGMRMYMNAVFVPPGLAAYCNLQPLAINLAPTQIRCFGENNGSIATTITGGVAPYKYSWTIGDTTKNLANRGPGTYTINVIDNVGQTASASASITEPVVLNSNFTVSNYNGPNISCNGANNGFINLSVSGGTAPYTYLWTPGGITTRDLSNLAPGTYSYQVTDARGCTSTNSTTLVGPPTLVAARAISNFNGFGVSCKNSTNGFINLNANGGVPPYTYLWSPGGNTTANLSNIGAGSYTYTVTDKNGCNVGGTVVLTAPTQLNNLNVISNYNGSGIKCFGSTDGFINLNVNGGTGPYTYAWTPGSSTTQNLTSIGAGTYSYVVTDFNGCTTTGSATITSPTQVTVFTTKTNYNGSGVSCNGKNDGVIHLATAGGTSPYSYSWSNGATTQNILNIGAGTYSYNVVDANGCTVSGSETLNAPTPLGSIQTASNFNGSGVRCNGSSDGFINLNTTGGTGPYSYSWSPGGMTTQNISHLTAGTYTYNVVDANGCSTSGSTTLIAPNPMNNNKVISNYNGSGVKCFGSTDGFINLTISGGTIPYTYAWTPGGNTSQNLTSIGVGTYSYVVTDLNGCTTSGSATIASPTQVTASTTVTNYNGSGVSCNGRKDGAIHLIAAGGTSPYSYSWSNGTNGQQILNIGAGTYSYNVVDANGCTISGSTTLSQPTALASIQTVSNYNGSGVTCNGSNDGFVNLNTTGGTGPYSFSWSPGGMTTQNINHLVAGTYVYTVVDANGCSGTGSAVLISPSPVNVLKSVSNYNGSGIKCNGSNDGFINLTVSGGTVPYTYAWTPGGNATSSLSNIGAGTYSYNVTDKNGCIVSGSSIITAPNPLGSLHSASTYNNNNISCNGLTDGYINLQVSGGTTPYNYTWMPNGIHTQNLSNLGAGNYSYSVIDANGCSDSGSIVLTEPSPLAALSTVSNFNGTNVSCNGSLNGSISLTVSGGTTPYSYQWTPTGSTASSLNNLGSGIYSYHVTDANGCNVSNNITLSSANSIATPYAVSNYNGSNVSCIGSTNGFIDLSVIGGTSPYSFAWSSGQTSQNISNLSAGTYTYTVTDANGCTSSNAIILAEPTLLDAPNVPSNFNGSNVSCFGSTNGSVNLNVVGGTQPYSFAWSIPGATSSSISNIGAGSYSYTVTDANGCTYSNSVSITQPAPMGSIQNVSNFNGYGVSCNGSTNGSIQISIHGGTTPYSYSWNSGLYTTPTISNLDAGYYSYSVTDANGCVLSNLVTITEPTLLQSNLLGTNYNGYNVACNGGNNGGIDLTIAGGVTGYNYLWTPGNTNTEDLTGVIAGTYHVKVTDANGCTVSSSITLTQPAALSISSTVDNAKCNGSNDGNIMLSPGGGVPSYNFVWSNGALTSGLTQLVAGTYSVVVSDINGCSNTQQYSISEPTALLATIQSPLKNGNNNISCNGLSDGTINSNVIGGSSPYSYSWSNGSTAPEINGLTIGTYSVTITDAHNCQSTKSITLIQPSPLNVSSGIHKDICGNNLTLTGNTLSPGRTGLWSILSGNATFTNNEDPEATVSGLNYGKNLFNWTITDGVCTESDTVSITAYEPVTADAGKSDTICPIVSDGFRLSATYNGVGIGSWYSQGFAHLESQSQSNSIVTGFSVGENVFVWTVTNGVCSASAEVTVVMRSLEDCLVPLEMPSGFTPNGDYSNDDFDIHGIEFYPNNIFEVYNRWGNLVYKADDYVNHQWKGTNTGGEELADGTYFVILKIKNSDLKLHGYVDLRK